MTTLFSEIGDGEKCSTDAGCSYDNAKCLSEYCTCDADRFVNTDAESCDLSKLLIQVLIEFSFKWYKCEHLSCRIFIPISTLSIVFYHYRG